jgi:hypothetical protein
MGLQRAGRLLAAAASTFSLDLQAVKSEGDKPAVMAPTSAAAEPREHALALAEILAVETLA